MSDKEKHQRVFNEDPIIIKHEPIEPIKPIPEEVLEVIDPGYKEKEERDKEIIGRLRKRREERLMIWAEDEK